MKKLIFILLTFSTACLLKAQTKKNIELNIESCGTPIPSAEWDAWFNQKVEEFKLAKAAEKIQSTNYTIPVIFHIIHSGQPVGTFPNLAQGQINSQITVLNQDFSATGFNVGNLPSTFINTLANTGISFCLAQKDSNGVTLAEPGIDRIDYHTKGWNDPSVAPYNNYTSFYTYMKSTIYPQSFWPPEKYLNIWVCDISNPTGMPNGFAWYPSGTPLAGINLPAGRTYDGIFVKAAVIGSPNIFPGGTYISGRYGRTASHEVGHYLGLRHIWGDAFCGNDYCNDTPTAGSPNSFCPSHPANVGNCPNNSTGEMTMNIMDYTSDACRFMFTKNQNLRMQTALTFGTFRSQLNANSANLCNNILSAPTASFFVPNTSCINSTVNVTNMTISNPIPTYSWSSNPSLGVTINSGTNSGAPTINFTTPGTYSISVIASNSLGISSNTQVISIGNTCITASFSIPAVVCANTSVNIVNLTTGTIAPTYSWSTIPSAGVVFSPNNTVSSPNVSFATPGIYNITVRALNSYGTLTNTQQIACVNNCATSCPDTIMNIVNTSTLSSFCKNSSDGYVFGNASYNFDQVEVAEFFNSSLYSNIVSPKIKSVIVLFYKDGANGTGGNSLSPVNLNLYNGTMSGGPTSTNNPIGQINATLGNILAVTPTNSVNYFGQPSVTYTSSILLPYRYIFSSPINAPTTDGFFASIQLPTAFGDTAVIMATNKPLGSNWYLTSYGEWGTFEDTWNVKASMAILPEIECGSTTSINKNSVLNANVSLHPNPSNGVVAIIATLPSSQNLEIAIHNTLGQLITKSNYVGVTNGMFNMDLTNYSNGVYFVTINNGEERIVKRLVLNK